MPLVMFTFVISLLMSSCVYQQQHQTPNDNSFYGYNASTLEIKE